MTWKECRLAALQTMFANEGNDINADDTNQDYLNAMPAKANEGMQLLALAGRPKRKSFCIVLGGGTEETAAKLTLPLTSGRYKVSLSHYCGDFRALEELKLETAAGYGAAEDWSLEGDDVLVLPGDLAGTYTVWYAAYPAKITAQTADEAELGLAEELCVLLPLYIASELYKEDDPSMATMWRNEFESGIARVREAWETGAGTRTAGRRPSVTGWW